jgi:hypothetical protein
VRASPEVRTSVNSPADNVGAVYRAMKRFDPDHVKIHHLRRLLARRQLDESPLELRGRAARAALDVPGVARDARPRTVTSTTVRAVLPFIVESVPLLEHQLGQLLGLPHGEGAAIEHGPRQGVPGVVDDVLGKGLGLLPRIPISDLGFALF